MHLKQLQQFNRVLLLTLGANTGQTLLKLLRQAGYDLFNILPGNMAKELSEIKPIVSGDLSNTNYLAVHQQKKQAFIEAYTGTIS